MNQYKETAMNAKHNRKLYFAPLEGITGYVFRQAHKKYYQGVDKYFIPFVSPTKNKELTNREKNDVLPEHNEGGIVVPQILTNSSEYFLDTAKILEGYGYTEINLNLGCPSGTVVTKGKGAGFLSDLDSLDRFLDEIFSSCQLAISLKTRIGMERPEEFEEILKVYNKYPVSELIIHPRCRSEFYKGSPNLDAFAYGYENSKAPVCYNGDIYSVEDYQNLTSRFHISTVMIGRGLLSHPALAEELKGIGEFDKEIFAKFHEEVLQGYEEIMSGERNTLFKMKELWFYLITQFPREEKAYKKIKKAQTVREYRQAVAEILSH